MSERSSSGRFAHRSIRSDLFGDLGKPLGEPIVIVGARNANGRPADLGCGIVARAVGESACGLIVAWMYIDLDRYPSRWNGKVEPRPATGPKPKPVLPDQAADTESPERVRNPDLRVRFR